MLALPLVYNATIQHLNLAAPVGTGFEGKHRENKMVVSLAGQGVGKPCQGSSHFCFVFVCVGGGWFSSVLDEILLQLRREPSTLSCRRDAGSIPYYSAEGEQAHAYCVTFYTNMLVALWNVFFFLISTF